MMLMSEQIYLLQRIPIARRDQMCDGVGRSLKRTGNGDRKS